MINLCAHSLPDKRSMIEFATLCYNFVSSSGSAAARVYKTDMTSRSGGTKSVGGKIHIYPSGENKMLSTSKNLPQTLR